MKVKPFFLFFVSIFAYLGNVQAQISMTGKVPLNICCTAATLNGMNIQQSLAKTNNNSCLGIEVRDFKLFIPLSVIASQSTLKGTGARYSPKDTTLSLVPTSLWVGKELVNLSKSYSLEYKGETYFANKGINYVFNVSYIGTNYYLYCPSETLSLTKNNNHLLDCFICPEISQNFSGINVSWIETTDNHIQTNFGLKVGMDLEDALLAYNSSASFSSLDSLGGKHEPCTMGTYMPIENGWFAYFTLKESGHCSSYHVFKDYKLSCFRSKL